MKRILAVFIMLMAGAAGAHADYYETTYHDLVKPHGRPRSDTIYQANLNICYKQTHENRTLPDTPAFRQCMLVHGYSFLSMHEVKTKPAPAYAGQA